MNIKALLKILFASNIIASIKSVEIIRLSDQKWQLNYSTSFKNLTEFNLNWSKKDKHIAFHSIRNKENVVINSTAGLELQTRLNTNSSIQINPATGLRVKWTTGYVFSKKNYGYGYYVADYVICGASGVNNAFWLTSNNGDEIDANEGKYTGQTTGTARGAYHNWNKNPFFHKWIYTRTLIGDLSVKYFKYGTLVTPTYIKWYINNRQVGDTLNITVNPVLTVRFSTAVAEFAGTISNGVENNTDIQNTKMTVRSFKFYTNVS